MGVMMLAASQHTWIELRANGEDEKEALEAITALISNKFGEAK
jgi:phosphocarrier protein